MNVKRMSAEFDKRHAEGLVCHDEWFRLAARASGIRLMSLLPVGAATAALAVWGAHAMALTVPAVICFFLVRAWSDKVDFRAMAEKKKADRALGFCEGVNACMAAEVDDGDGSEQPP